MSQSVIRIATRTSDLALWQAEYIAARLRELTAPPDVQIVPITTSGDRDQTSPLQQFGGTGAFTKEVQNAVLDERADIAVHSLKDLPTVSTNGLRLAAVPERASTADVLVIPDGVTLPESADEIPAIWNVGTGSPRRHALLRRLNPELKISAIRGNVPTRLQKLDDGEFDAIVLAEAGLCRLGLEYRTFLRLTPPHFFPAVGQGALGIECRAADEETATLLQQIQCEKALREVTAERTLLAALQAGCHAPVGVAVRHVDDGLELTGVLLDLEGREFLIATHTGQPDAPAEIGNHVAQQLLDAGGAKLLGDS